jgi:4-diphosphocytidyl-2-C-methyl-D-erythritol kinase
VQSVTVRVPAKVNLYLGVGGRRRDGYHDLTNVFQAVSLYDEVTAAGGSGPSVRVEGEAVDGVPVDADNLAVRAAVALAAATGREPDVALTITKRIPVAGGMAGGSADAAAALLACDALWGTAVPRTELTAIAAGLGADVPFLLTGGTALGVGRGDQLTPVLGRGSYYWVLALADRGLSTATVYAELDRLRGDTEAGAPSAPDEVMSALRAGDAAALGRAMRNDLGSATLRLRPQLSRALDTGRDLGALGGVISGSGPTLAFLCASQDLALRFAAAFSGAGVCRSTRVVHGPVPGAHVVESAEARS